MEFSIKLYTIKSEWSIVRTLNFSKILYFSLKINFALANSVDSDEMQHYAAFHQGLHCLPKYPIRCFRP